VLGAIPGRNLLRTISEEMHMTAQSPSDRVVGKTLRWTFTEGPQAGKTYEHSFHPDGTVEYRMIEDPTRDPSIDSAARTTDPGSERPPYAAYAVSETVELVSYRAGSGFTLTVALNFADQQLVSIASNSEQWFPARGTFAEMGT
jgi:hypothetical protein